MNARDAQDDLLMLSGVMLLAVGLTDLHLRYVKPQMQPLLVLAGAFLVGLGIVGLRRSVLEARARKRSEHPPDPHGAGHDEHRTRPSSWLLVLPLLVLSLVAPPALGSYAAARTDTRIAEPTIALPPLPAPRDGAVDLTLTEYYSRVLYDEASLDGARVRLSGFVTPVGGRWFVTRMSLSCCAADGRPIKVLTGGAAAASPPPADTWVEVVGTVTGTEAPAEGEVPVPVVLVESVQTIDEPRDPYE